ncbi:AAA-family ATPase [Agrobacterium tumefaciens str. Kerr 14]|uniref:AAA-family ATPase n=1 Tax=Agrobacterium tumefaciens str. Kerr 14 TaxID=1183424 RepID=A0A1S7SBS3_AGRTU|nr:ATP-binding protein [Agrobacterium tumefaciens]CUX66046.1 AAA-family ATPase [Agrobacterium tumefaciens str. Kerr 14]
MTTAQQLISLLKSHVEGDDEQFLTIALQAAASEARRGHGKVAVQLRELVDAARSNKDRTSGRKMTPVPIAQPRGDLANLVAVRYADIRLSSMILPSELEVRLKRVILEQRQQHKLRSHGLSPRRKIMLIGPPGSGKTMTAAALAGELNTPLFTVQLDGLMTKFMGETASKLRLVFSAMAETKGVYFFDEFDAIGARRAERNDVGEIRRVLNSFLQFLEEDESEGLIVAATNHPELLDPALFRRFDDVIEYTLPTIEVATGILQSRLSSFDTGTIDWTKAVAEASGLSQAEIVRAAADAAKMVILSDRDRITQDDLSLAIAERKGAASQ